MKTLLVANRGEIAVRVIRTCREQGIRSIALYSKFDSNSPHRFLADEAYELQGETTSETYLNIEQILAIAKRSHADAVHPGYGFLSESPLFAEALKSAGIIFVGPSTETLTLAGSKDQARKLAASLEIKTPAGYDEADQELPTLLKAAEQIGTPLLVKAVAGGGGRGMRLIRATDEISDAVKSAADEAEKFFGDRRIILEQYIPSARHIEVQLVGDASGNVVHLYERDCSLQRRYQKLIEESPARDVPSTILEQIFESALKLGKAIKLQGVATAEFLLSTTSDATNFYFLEINPRIQVEHPVTELITGVDIVALQLDIAQGKPLPFQQPDILRSGFAIEARVCAELPALQFQPSSGTLQELTLPSDPRIRFDHALQDGIEIGPRYDSLLLKAIAHGDTAEEARDMLLQSLRSTHLLGVDTNIWFLEELLSSEYFGGRKTPHTKLLDERSTLRTSPDEQETRLLAERALGAHLARTLFPEVKSSRAFMIPELEFAVECVALERAWHIRALLKRVSVEGEHFQLQFLIDGKSTFVSSCGREAKHSTLGLSQEATLSSVSGFDAWFLRSKIEVDHFHFVVQRLENWRASAEGYLGENILLSPLPGTVLELKVHAGAQVSRGDILLVLESMKTEHSLRAARDGIITSVLTSKGSQVTRGQALLELTSSAPPEESPAKS